MTTEEIKHPLRCLEKTPQSQSLMKEFSGEAACFLANLQGLFSSYWTFYPELAVRALLDLKVRFTAILYMEPILT